MLWSDYQRHLYNTFKRSVAFPSEAQRTSPRSTMAHAQQMLTARPRGNEIASPRNPDNLSNLSSSRRLDPMVRRAMSPRTLAPISLSPATPAHKQANVAPVGSPRVTPALNEAPAIKPAIKPSPPKPAPHRAATAHPGSRRPRAVNRKTKPAMEAPAAVPTGPLGESEMEAKFMAEHEQYLKSNKNAVLNMDLIHGDKADDKTLNNEVTQIKEHIKGKFKLLQNAFRSFDTNANGKQGPSPSHMLDTYSSTLTRSAICLRTQCTSRGPKTLPPRHMQHERSLAH